jgi:hypothetical protein
LTLYSWWMNLLPVHWLQETHRNRNGELATTPAYLSSLKFPK